MKIYKLISCFLLLLAINNSIIAQMPGTPYLTKAILTTPAVVTALTCASATQTGTLADATAASGVSISVPYSGGNGGSYSAYSISSTGVTGLTASAAAGSIATGSGSIVFSISGTPSAAGTATFALTLGGLNCSFSATVTAAPSVVTNCATPQCYPLSYTVGANTVIASMTKDGVSISNCINSGISEGHTNVGGGCAANAIIPSVPTRPKPYGSFLSGNANGSTSTYIITFSVPVNNASVLLALQVDDNQAGHFSNGTVTIQTSSNGTTYTNPTLANTNGCTWTVGTGTITSNGAPLESPAVAYTGVSYANYKITSATKFTQLKITVPVLPDVDAGITILTGPEAGQELYYHSYIGAFVSYCPLTF